MNLTRYAGPRRPVAQMWDVTSEKYDLSLFVAGEWRGRVGPVTFSFGQQILFVARPGQILLSWLLGTCTRVVQVLQIALEPQKMYLF